MSVPAWADQTIHDDSRMNKTTIISGTGAYLAALDFSKFKILFCTSSGSGFTINNAYLCRTDGSGVDPLTGTKSHDHTNSTSEGGDFFDVLSANGTLITQHFSYSMQVAEWTSVVSGTGSTSSYSNHGDWPDQEVIECSTGTTNGSGANWRLGAQPIDYGAESEFNALGELDQVTSIAFKYGYCMENATSADDNTRKYGIVGCTSVNGNFFARSADGDSRSDSDMGVPFAPLVGNPMLLTAHKQEDAADGIDYYVEQDDLLNKTSDTPTSGNGCDSNHFRFCVKNNTGADRTITLGKLMMRYHSTNNWW